MLTIIMNAMQKFNEGLAFLEGYFLPETIKVNIDVDYVINGK